MPDTFSSGIRIAIFPSIPQEPPDDHSKKQWMAHFSGGYDGVMLRRRGACVFGARHTAHALRDLPPWPAPMAHSKFIEGHGDLARHTCACVHDRPSPWPVGWWVSSTVTPCSTAQIGRLTLLQHDTQLPPKWLETQNNSHIAYLER